MWVFLILMFGDGPITLKSGEVLEVERYRRFDTYLLLSSGDEVFSLPEQKVDWVATTRAQPKSSGESNWAPVAKEAEERLPGREFVIGRLDVKQASLIDLIRFLADMVDFNLYIDNSVKDRPVTYLFKNIPWTTAMEIILGNAGLDAEIQYNLVSVRPLSQATR